MPQALTINLRGARNTPELAVTLSSLVGNAGSPDFVMVTETWAALTLPPLPGYNLWPSSSSTPPRSWGGCALFTRSSVPATFYRPRTGFECADVALVRVPGGMVGAVYVSPNPLRSKDIPRFISWLSTLKGAVIVGGDFNARSRSWDNRDTPCGLALVSSSLQVHAPLSRTFRAGPRESTVDLFASKGRVTVADVPVVLAGIAISDHCPVQVSFSWPSNGKEPKFHPIPPRVLHDPAVWEKAVESYRVSLPRLSADLAMVQTAEKLDAVYTAIADEIRAPFVAASPKARSQDPWEKSLKELSRRRSRAYRAGDLTLHRALDRQIKRAHRSFMRRRRERLLQRLASTSDVNEQARLRRALGLGDRRPQAPILVRRRFTDMFFEKIQAVSGARTLPQWNTKFAVTQEQLSPVFARALQLLQSRRAPGIDGVYPEMLRSGGSLVVGILTALWCTCGRIGAIPSVWSQVVLVPVYKSGHRANPQNYRPIGILSVLRRVVDNALNQFLQEYYTPSPAQLGFRPHTGVDHAFSRLHRQIQANNGAYVVSLDLKSAYDTVSRVEYMHDLKCIVPPALLCQLASTAGPTRISTAGDPAGVVRVLETGVTQGDPKAPTIFSVFLESLLSRLSLADAEFYPAVADGLSLDPWFQQDLPRDWRPLPRSSVTAYADDVTLITHCPTHMQHLLNICTEWARERGMQWAPQKCQVIAHPRLARPSFLISGQPLSYKEQIRCLGLTLSPHGFSPSLSLSRIRSRRYDVLKWARTLPLNPRSPRYPFRRAVIRQFLSPTVDFGLPWVPLSSDLSQAATAWDSSVAHFFCGFRRPKRVSLDRVQAIGRFESLMFRRSARAQAYLLQVREALREHVVQQDWEVWVDRALDAQSTPLWEQSQPFLRDSRPSFLVEFIQACPSEQRFTRRLPPPVPDASRPIQSRPRSIPLPPAMAWEGSIAYYALLFYLNLFPRGLHHARESLGPTLTQETFDYLCDALARPHAELDFTRKEAVCGILRILARYETVAHGLLCPSLPRKLSDPLRCRSPTSEEERAPQGIEAAEAPD